MLTNNYRLTCIKDDNTIELKICCTYVQTFDT